MAWAVAVEFQFYLLYPFLIRFVNRSALKAVAGVIAVALLFRLLGLGFWANARDMSYWHLLGRIDQFLLGMGTAVVLRTMQQRMPRWMLPASIALVIAVLFAFHRLGGWPSVAPWKILWPTVEGIMWSAFILAYVGTPPWLPSMFDRAFRRIGEMSFSIYLLHYPLIDIVRYRLKYVPRWTGNDSMDALLSTLLIVLPLLLFYSWFTYNIIEKPFLNLRVPYLKTIDEYDRKRDANKAG